MDHLHHGIVESGKALGGNRSCTDSAPMGTCVPVGLCAAPLRGGAGVAGLDWQGRRCAQRADIAWTLYPRCECLSMPVIRNTPCIVEYHMPAAVGVNDAGSLSL